MARRDRPGDCPGETPRCNLALSFTYRDMTMPGKMVPRLCGCGGMTRGGWYIPGHDQKPRSAIEEKVGGLLELKALVEKTFNCAIGVKS